MIFRGGGNGTTSSSSSLTPAFERLSHRDVESQQRPESHGKEGGSIGSNYNVRRSSRILLQESSRRAQTQSQEKNSNSTNSNNKKKTSTAIAAQRIPIYKY